MTKVTVKSWFADKAQANAGGFRTIMWEKTCVNKTCDHFIGNTSYDDMLQAVWFFNEKDNWEQASSFFGEIIKETEKAICLECDWWDLRYGYSIDTTPVRHGWKVWIPKSVIYGINHKKFSGKIEEV